MPRARDSNRFKKVVRCTWESEEEALPGFSTASAVPVPPGRGNFLKSQTSFLTSLESAIEGTDLT